MRTAQDIILKPVITEDSMDRLQANRYTFKVAKDANKIEIAKAVEELFNVKVAKVNTISVKGKQKRMGRSVGYRPRLVLFGREYCKARGERCSECPLLDICGSRK